MHVQLQRNRAERPAMLLHGPCNHVHHLMEQGLRVRGEDVGFRGVSGQVEEQRWVVMDYLVSRARADPSPVAGTGALWVEHWGCVVDFP